MNSGESGLAALAIFAVLVYAVLATIGIGIAKHGTAITISKTMQTAKYSAGDKVIIKDKFYSSCYGTITDYYMAGDIVAYNVRLRCIAEPKPYYLDKDFRETELEISN